MDHILQVAVLDILFNGGLDRVLIPGVGMDTYQFTLSAMPLTHSRGGTGPGSGRRPPHQTARLKMPTTITQAMTIRVLLTVCLPVGHTTFFNSIFSSRNQRPMRAKTPGLDFLSDFLSFLALSAWERRERSAPPFRSQPSLLPFFPFSHPRGITSSHCGRCAFCRRGSTC